MITLDAYKSGTGNKEVMYTNYEVHVIQELSSNLVSKLYSIDWEDKTIYELNEYVRDVVFGEYFDYLVEQGFITSLATSVSEADFMSQNTIDLEVIDAFCEQKLLELGYKKPLPKYEQANYDTLIEFGIQCGNLFGVGYEKLNDWGVECDKAWRALDEETRDEKGWIEFCEEFLDKKRVEKGMPTLREECEATAKKKEAFDYDVAYILVQLTEDFSKELYEKYDKMYQDTNLRGEFLHKMAIEIAKSKEWKDSDTTAGEVIEKAIENKRRELAIGNAKFKKGDIAYVLDDFVVQKVKIIELHIVNSSEIVYDIIGVYSDISATYVSESYIYKSPSEIISSIQCDIDNGTLK